ncbi:slightly ste11-like protein [Ophidiomyces ophidiicola]|uniref:slightly ste11-like protein n=1 Tax=Ophidiomyces ophidiicola TaxID=1387563 RepID=UPI0020C1D46B|nr:slightly ste11-like protein [Ophidiomyces ophidiicola]KAI1944901.1 slightly ste11-like protein [Ophidiomyces ophidiicola]KAI1952398.1 slightly ste11-like protein [Ophidiomyces ophidiicola]KAI2041854.1 slightly ste11-like protein [Ophidiomyces ophidiicola]KAI2053489.1 slightly ste11-like protein [Ophidiomyces ophidiicola]KAI2058161.1 slightly ste11-like protein [Ophidiomyces ophidiicola]
MSYDRVLPKPLGLFCDLSSRGIPPRVSSLLGHRIVVEGLNRPSRDQHGRQLSTPSGTPPSSIPTARCQGPDFGPSKEHALHKAPESIPIPLSGNLASSGTVLEASRNHRAASAGSSKSTSSRDSSVLFCLCQPDPKIPRPRNAFILFRQHFQAAVVAQNPGLANPEISKIIGEKWRNLPVESKQDWKNLAEEEKARHQQQYPDYRYQPRRYGRKGSNAGAASSGISNNPTGASVCNRCGGRVMNAPPTPIVSIVSSTQRQGCSAPPHINKQPSADAKSSRKRARSVSPLHSHLKQNQGTTAPTPHQDKDGLFSPDMKRGRWCPIRQNFSSCSTYSQRSSSYPRLETLHLKGQNSTESPRPFRTSSFSKPVQDPRLVLPPLQTLPSTNQSSQSQVKTLVMTIPFLNKIKVLSKISPPFSTSMSAQSCQGAVIAVEGQDHLSVQCVLEYLKNVLSSRDGQIVHIFEGPDPASPEVPTKAEETRDATVQYLKTISKWHKISEDILRFINNSSTISNHQSHSLIPSRENSPTFCSLEKRGWFPENRTSQPSDSIFRIALVPQYQLSTADAHACTTPINDAYAPIDHWQWMASLWRGCVGPDVTICIRDCEKEELETYGEGNPVEIRLEDTRTLVVRRRTNSEKSIEEKALRRIGFEVGEFIRR